MKSSNICLGRGEIVKLHVTRHYLNNVLKGDLNHPLVSTLVKRGETIELPHLSNAGFEQQKPEIIVQKYKPNMILLLTRACLQKCSYCFRKGNNNAAITPAEVQELFSGIRADKQNNLVEIILSGGEPLMVKRKLMRLIADEICMVNSKRKDRSQLPLILTVHTRLPVVAPLMFKAGVMETIELLSPSNMDLHVIHPDEITEDFVSACMQLHRRMPGISLRTIHPLLRGVNDDPDTLKQMYTKLCLEAGVLPRDLILPMPGSTSPELMLGLGQGMAIMRQLRDILPGHLLPTLVVCSPIYGKSYTDPFHMKEDGSFGYDVKDGFIQGLFIKDGSGLQHSSAAMI